MYLTYPLRGDFLENLMHQNYYILFPILSTTALNAFKLKLFGDTPMNKIIKIAAATALVVASASASAWWGGGPFTTFTDEFFGDGVGDGSFDMNMNANTRTYGRGYGYDRYFAGPYAHGPYGYPYAPVAPVAPVAPLAQAPLGK